MRAPANRRVFVVGRGAATALGATMDRTWERAVAGESGFRRLTRGDFEIDPSFSVVGEIPDWDPAALDFTNAKEIHNWNAGFIHLTMAVCREALNDAGLELDGATGARTACLVGSAINGHDAFRVAKDNLDDKGPFRVSPYLLPNLCANLPAGKAGMLLGFTGPVFSPQGACASGNHAIGLAARMIRDGDCDFALAGGAEWPLIPEILVGFDNMHATVTLTDKDRAWNDPGQASRPFSVDRKGFVLAEGAGVLTLAAEEAVKAHGLRPRAEVLGVGWTSDAHHITAPHTPTIIRAIRDAIEDAELQPEDIDCVNAHGTSTPRGDASEVVCLREVFGRALETLPVSANKSQVGHSLGAAAAIEAALAVEGLQRGLILPTANLLPDPELSGLDFVVGEARKLSHERVLSNAFGFGGTNCCLVLGAVA
jgi:3-oxoacyl-[acyl-carrier-protein] synthase II